MNAPSNAGVTPTANLFGEDDVWSPRQSLGTHVFLGTAIVLVIGFFIWAVLGKLDVVSNAMGEVVPSSKVKTVQHLEGGIVLNILVREGERVQTDQPLIELQPTVTDSQLEEVMVRLSSLRAKVARLEAEIAGKDAPTFPPDLIANNLSMITSMEALFRARQQRVKSQIDEQNQIIAQRDQEIKEIEGRIATNESGIKLVEDQLKISERLLELNLTNRMRHLDLQKEVENRRGQINADRTALPKARSAQKQAYARLAAVQSGFQEESRLDLDETQRNVDELTQRRRKLEDSLTRTVLRAPVDGIVKTLNVATKGGVIQPGATVAEIVPADDRLVIDAKLPTRDIGYVRPGQRVMIRLASSDAARFGIIESEVANVSPDTLINEQGVPFYKVRIETNRAFFEQGGLRYDLFPGMQVQADIQTGTRTVLQYLLDPYFRSVEVALRER
ncbi:MAG: putative type secretion rane fusion protein HlyD family [Rhodospirillales bacterium]|jgi:adhesin transport system membrane fusion protein|nr:putative type secretion rane fusion protein HlyD family [Rhodospirillales bacterium]